MRIWHQSITSLETLSAYGRVLEARLPSLVSAGVEVVTHGLPAELYAGRPPAEVLRYPYARYRIHERALGCAAEAERQGFDAVTFATFAEPVLQQARSIVDIPVVSMLEASLLVGCSMARRMALVTLAPENVRRLQERLDDHRFAPWAHGTAARRSAGGIRLECSHDRRTALGLLSHIRPGAVFLAERA